MKDYCLIKLFNVTVIFVVNGMYSNDGYHHVSHLELLTEKSLRYLRHRKNYLESLQLGIIAWDLKLKKKL